MNAPSPPALTVRTDGSQRTFAPGHDVVIGRDLRADVRVAHPLVSRAHIVLRFDQGRWTAIDNGSLNGMFVDNRRVQSVDLRDGQAINLGNPDGPRLTFEVGRHQGAVGRPPQTSVAQMASRPPSGGVQAPLPPTSRPPVSRPPSGPGPQAYPSGPPSGPQVRPPSGPQVRPPSAPQPVSRPPSRPAQPVAPANYQQTQIRPAPAGAGQKMATSMIRIMRGGGPAAPPTGAIKIGRATDNDIVIPDVLASRHHATLVPTASGTEIIDERSINGTFVNGNRVDRASLGEGDVVTIGNVDLVFKGGDLVRRTQTEADTRTGGLDVRGVSLVIDKKTLLDNISLSARPGTLTAVIGPSGAGKSTLAKVIVGTTTPTQRQGAVRGTRHSRRVRIAAQRIGMVPQDDVVHRQLTVNQALGYAAELRMPPDTNKEDRRQVINAGARGTRADPARREARRQAVRRPAQARVGGAGVADRPVAADPRRADDGPGPGAGPPGDDDAAPACRRRSRRRGGDALADVSRRLRPGVAARSRRQDRVLRTAGKIGTAMGTTDWADIFSEIASRSRRGQIAVPGAAPPAAPHCPSSDKPVDLGKPVHTSLLRQFSTIARRQVRLIVADRGYFIFLVLLPFIVGVLPTTVPGTAGFDMPSPTSESPNEPGTILVLLNVGAIFMGTALTIRALIGERAIYLREQAVGLSTTAYLLAKVCVFTVFAVLQATIAVVITVLGKGAPTQGAVMLQNPTFELWFDVAFTCVAAAMVGLALSGLARSNEQIMPLLVVAIMSQLVFSGGMIPVTGRLVLDQLSWFTPARWGFAASASTADLTKLVPGPATPKDSHWRHTGGAWLFDVAMLMVVCVGYATFVRWRLRLKAGG